MPGVYTQYRFGIEMLPAMPGDTRRSIQRFRRLYDVGLHGPDIFKYQLQLVKNNTSRLDQKFLAQSGQDFFQRVCRMSRLEKSEAYHAYIYGLLCCFSINSALTPILQEHAQKRNIPKAEIETEFDRFLLEKDGKIPACTQDLSPHLKLTPGEHETVARFYPPAKAGAVRDSLKNMTRVMKLLASPEGMRRSLLGKGMGIAGENVRAMFMTAEPNPRCAELNEALFEAYQQAKERFPDMLQQLQEHLTYNADLEESFARNFLGE